jgi:S1-C subfamily serine protease
MIAAAFLLHVLAGCGLSDAPDDVIVRAEQRRIEMIERVAPSVVCVFDSHQRGGGSGVLIDDEGHGLTNYHVVAEMLNTRRGLGGLGDGKLYELEVLGVDPTGDVAMFRLLGEHPFPFAVLGDSDAVRVGDTAVAMGNPFTISEDYTPTVTTGLVTGVHRYQAGTGKNLVYSDCLQIDASINPGNSGGPLFNAAGEIIGINGRISVNRRGRLNVGFGYAIAANQIKRFIPALRAGLKARHGTLQATVATEGQGVVFDRVAPDSAVAAAGIRRGDRLLSLDGVPMISGNQYLGLLGGYPADWPVPLVLESEGARREVVVRLDPVTPKAQRPFEPQCEVALREIERVLRRFQKAAFTGSTVRRPMSWKCVVTREAISPPDNARKETLAASQVGDGPMRLERLRDDGSVAALLTATEGTVLEHIAEDSLTPPDDMRMYLAAIYVMQRWLLEAVETIDFSNVRHAGGDRWLPSDPAAKIDGAEKILEVLEWNVLQHAWAKFAFDQESGRLLRIRVRDVPTGAEVLIDLSEHADIGGIIWPRRLDVRVGARHYRDTLSRWEFPP